MIKINFSTAFRDFFPIALVIGMLIIIPLSLHAQYYPAPAHVPAVQEREIYRAIKTTKNKASRIDLLLKLCNIYYYKPLKSNDDFPKALRYANQARLLSKELKDTNRLAKCLEALATIYILTDSLTNVERILPLFHNPVIKNNVELGLAFTYIFCPERPLKDLIRGKSFAEECLKESKKLHLKNNELFARQYLAFVQSLVGDAKSAERDLQVLIKEYKEQRLTGIQYPYLILADIHWLKGKFTETLQDVHNASAAIEQNGDKTALGDIYLGLSSIYHRINEPEKEREALRSALDNFKLRLGRYTPNQVLSSVSARMIKDHHYAAALEYLDKNTKIFNPVVFDQRHVSVNSYANVYLALGKYKMAEHYFIEGYKMVKQADWLVTNDYSNMGYFYIEHKDYAKAKPFLLKAVESQDRNTSDYTKRQLTYMLFLADSAMGNYRSAIRYLSRNHKLDDSLEESKRKADVQSLLIKFETRKKEDLIRNLKQNQTLSRIREERANVLRNAIVGAAIMFLFIAIIFYWQYNGKKKLSREILKKNVRQEAILKQLNKVIIEKEWLLKEVHHRVKNNLHTVMCLLESQALYLESDALKAIEDSKHRIYAMSLIHQRLYETENSKSIDLQPYIQEFVGYLKDSFVIGNSVHFELDVEPVVLDVAAAIPMALVINEAVTNSIKHAFKGQSNAQIRIILHTKDEVLTLTIADNGIGIQERKKNGRVGSLGMKLINGLCEDLNGTVQITSDHGTKIIFVCNVNPFEQEIEYEENISLHD
ncbi:tetratricopeptide repeat-containing sensor histidine kinase [Pedobacter jamesrossensis]|uniref:histidine kinase n=1 Tax=Pedobacter jamesrossensis TaxID=1908238 RepID=A0ABV8NLF5_9SPHI